MTVVKLAVVANDKDEASPVSTKPPLKRKRVAKSKCTAQDNELVPPVLLTKKRAKKSDTFSRVSYTVATILSTWDDASEYGISFRGLNSVEQENEVKRMNKVVAPSLKQVQVKQV